MFLGILNRTNAKLESSQGTSHLGKHMFSAANLYTIKPPSCSGKHGSRKLQHILVSNKSTIFLQISIQMLVSCPSLLAAKNVKYSVPVQKFIDVKLQLWEHGRGTNGSHARRCSAAVLTNLLGCEPPDAALCGTSHCLQLCALAEEV